MPYAIATPEQTRAKSTAWSLKKSIGGPPWNLRREAPGAAVFYHTRLEARAAESGCAEMFFGLRRDLREDREQQLPQPLVVLLEDLDHGLVAHRVGPLDADVVVGDHRDVRVAELQLPGEVALGVGGHVDHVPAGVLEPARLGAGREARALDRDHRAAVADRDRELAGRVDQKAPQVRAVGVGGRDVRRLGPVVERVRPAGRAVDELVADDELAELQVGLERAGGVRADDPPYAQLAHRPNVGAVRDPVRRQLVLAPVPRQECDAGAADLADHERRRRLAVRRVELDLLDLVQERVEARAAEDPDRRLRHAAAKVTSRRPG